MKKPIVGVLLAIAAGLSAAQAMDPPYPKTQAKPPAQATLFKRSEYVPPQNQGMMKNEQREKIAHFGPGRMGTKELTFVKVNREALKSKTLTLEMPDGKNYTFTGGLIEVVGDYCWNGKIMRAGAIAGVATICPGSGDHIDGEIFVGGKHFHLTDNGDHQLLRELQQPEPKASAPKKVSAAEPEEEAVAVAESEVNPLILSNGSGMTPRTIRVLTVWLGGAPSQAGSSNIDATSRDLLKRAQTKLINSMATNIKLEYAGTQRKTATTWDNQLPGNTLDLVLANDDMKRMRDNANADIVAVICKCATVSGPNIIKGASGAVGGGEGGSPTVVAGPEDAFFVVAATYIAEDEMVYEHEFGHSLGARHAYTGSMNDDTNDSPLPNSHGYSIMVSPLGGAMGSLGWCASDVMVSVNRFFVEGKCPYGQMRYPFYSNPSLTVNAMEQSSLFPTFPLGLIGSHADAVGAFLQWAPTVSNFAETARLYTVQTSTPVVVMTGPPTSPPVYTYTPIFGLMYSQPAGVVASVVMNFILSLP